MLARSTAAWITMNAQLISIPAAVVRTSLLGSEKTKPQHEEGNSYGSDRLKDDWLADRFFR